MIANIIHRFMALLPMESDKHVYKGDIIIFLCTLISSKSRSRLSLLLLTNVFVKFHFGKL